MKLILFPYRFLRALSEIAFIPRANLGRSFRRFLEVADIGDQILFSSLFSSHFVQGRISGNSQEKYLEIWIPETGIYSNLRIPLTEVVKQYLLENRIEVTEEDWSFIIVRIKNNDEQLNKVIQALCRAMNIPRLTAFRVSSGE